MERRIKDVKQGTIDAFYPGFSLVAFYEKVAEEFQIPFNNGDRFDCTKIRIASNIREQWYKRFEKEYGEARRWELNMHLCMSSPRVDKYLQENEVEVQEGWISKAE